MFLFPRDLWYSLAMLLWTVFVFRRLRLRPEPVGYPLLLTAHGAFGLVLGMACARSFADLLRFAAAVIFVHWPLLALLIARSEWAGSRRRALIALAIAATLTGIGLDAFVIEPSMLEIRRDRLESPKLSRPFKLVFIADPQIAGLGETEKRPWLVAMAEKPDLIILGGDYSQAINEARRRPFRAQLNEFLRGIGFSAPLGIYAVRGNLDLGRWDESFASLPVRLFPEGGQVGLPGLRMTFLAPHQAILPSLRVRGAEGFHLVVGHYPDFSLGSIDGDLLLAGHTHGGQVRLPGIGPLFPNSQVPRRMAEGWTFFPDGPAMLVSRGAGMVRGFAPRVRFLCPPEIHVIDLVPAPASQATRLTRG